MVASELIILEFQQLILAILATFVLGLVCIRRKDLTKWLYAYITLTIGLFLTRLKIIDEIFNDIGAFFLGMASFLICFAVLLEYCQTFSDKAVNQLKNKTILTLYIISAVSWFVIFIDILMLFILIISNILLILIVLKKKTITHVFLLLSLIAAALSVFSEILEELNIYGTYEFGEGMDNIFFTILMLTGFVAYLEDKIIKSEEKTRDAYNRVEFYKDLFAHDIGNILQNVQSSMDLLPRYIKDPNKSKESLEIMDIIKQQVKRGSSLISNVRNLSELEEHEILLKKIDALAILQEAIEHLKNSFEGKPINVKIEGMENKYPVTANELLLNVFENLLNNSVKHNQNSIVEILIIIKRNEKDGVPFVEFSFMDNGVGVSDAMKNDIFQRTIRMGESKRGMGLGLSLVKKIIERYNGEIRVEDKIKGDHSKGSNFIVILPEMLSNESK